jgi:hypothetical protein
MSLDVECDRAIIAATGIPVHGLTPIGLAERVSSFRIGNVDCSFTHRDETPVFA